MAIAIDRRTFLAQTSALGLAACGGGGSSSSSTTTTPTTTTTPDVTPTPVVPVQLKMLVPAYRYDSVVWDALAATQTPLVIIANASNGPGKRWDAKYQGWIDSVRNAGHTVKGYVYTGYGTRSSAAVLADIEAWNTFYDLTDFFLDEASAAVGDLPYYRNIINQAIAAFPSRQFMLNPGTAPDAGYFGLPSGVEILVYEKPWYSYTSSSLPTWLKTYASQCWIMALSASESDMQAAAAVTRARNFAGFFATDLAFTAGLPSYWANEVKLSTTI